MKIRRIIINNHITRKWSNWENEIVSSHPTITVSDRVAEELKTRTNNSKKIFVVPNFPLRSEASGFEDDMMKKVFRVWFR